MPIEVYSNQHFLTCRKSESGLKNPYTFGFNKHRQAAQSAINFKGLDAMIFDADGTMVVTKQSHNKAWARLCLKHRPTNLSIIELFKNFPHEGTTEEIIKQLYRNIPTEKVKRYADEKEDFFLKFAKNIKEVKGLAKFIESAPSVKKAIATCAAPRSLAFYLKKMNLIGYFNNKFIIDSSMVEKGKPDPEVYLKAAKALNVIPQNCAVFEDSSEGIKAALKAGMKVIGVATSLSKEKLTELGASFAIKDYTEVDLPKLMSLFEKEVTKINF